MDIERTPKWYEDILLSMSDELDLNHRAVKVLAGMLYDAFAVGVVMGREQAKK